MDQIEVIYFTDPLCCWSWSSEPQWKRLRMELGERLKWRYCMGGLLPSWKGFKDEAHSVFRPVQMGPMWMEASHLSGVKNNSSIWIFNPPASSYPSCIAVKCVELQSQFAADEYLSLLREAVMLNARNIAQWNVLVELADELAKTSQIPFNVKKFANDLHSQEARQLFRKDLEEVRLKNITRFPSLLFKKAGVAPLLLTGYKPYQTWLELVRKLDHSNSIS